MEREPHIIFEESDLFYDYYICEGCALCDEAFDPDGGEIRRLKAALALHAEPALCVEEGCPCR